MQDRYALKPGPVIGDRVFATNKEFQEAGARCGVSDVEPWEQEALQAKDVAFM